MWLSFVNKNGSKKLNEEMTADNGKVILTVPTVSVHCATEFYHIIT